LRIGIWDLSDVKKAVGAELKLIGILGLIDIGFFAQDPSNIRQYCQQGG
jgi:hypothetical protein